MSIKPGSEIGTSWIEQQNETDRLVEAIWAAAPTTTRGQPTQLSCDPKGERISYAVSKNFTKAPQKKRISKTAERVSVVQ